MAFVAAGVAVVAAGAGIYGASVSSSAAKSAAGTQAGAADRATQLQRDIFNRTRADQEPYISQGSVAIRRLADLTYAPLTYDRYTPTPAYAPNAAYTGPTEAELRADPGYQFRVTEGQKALERSAASKGLLLSGGQLKDLTRFGQDLGAQEYGNVYARGYARNQDTYARGYTENQDVYGRNLQAYNTNYNTLLGLRNLQFGELASIAGAGQGAVNTLGQIGARTGANLAETTVGAGNARAAGIVGSANAVNAGLASIAGAGNQFANYQLLSSLFQRPQTPPPTGQYNSYPVPAGEIY